MDPDQALERRKLLTLQIGKRESRVPLSAPHCRPSVPPSVFPSALRFGRRKHSFARRACRSLHACPAQESIPARNLIERAKASAAQSRHRVDDAHADARRGRRPRDRDAAHDALGPARGSLASSARATRETGRRPRKSQMKWPAMRSPVMSTPVSGPQPFEQVQNVLTYVARCPLRIRTTVSRPKPAMQLSNVAMPSSIAAETSPACRRHRGGRKLGDGHHSRHRAHKLLRLARGTGADGIAERDFVAAHRLERCGDITHAGRIDVALVRAAENAGDVAAGREPRVPLAASATGFARSRLSSTPQLMFFRENVSEAATNMAPRRSRRPAPPRSPWGSASAPDNARPACGGSAPSLRRCPPSGAPDFGDTKLVASITGKPASVSRSINDLYLRKDPVSFSSEVARGPTLDHGLTCCGSFMCSVEGTCAISTIPLIRGILPRIAGSWRRSGKPTPRSASSRRRAAST